jgi:hypothetical protein
MISLFLSSFSVSNAARFSGATLTGDVRETSQLAAPRARLTLQQPETGRRRSTATRAEGGHRIEGLPPAPCLLAVAYAGFVAPPREVSFETLTEVPLDIAAACPMPGERVPLQLQLRAANGLNSPYRENGFRATVF